MKNWKSAILATTILAAAAQPAMAQTGPWDPATAIGGTSASTATVTGSPTTGQWSTVRMSGAGCNTAGTLAQLSGAYVNPLATTIGGRDGNLTASQDQPLVARNFGAAVTPDFTAIPANALVMHPGPAGECSIVRLTVPPGGSGTYAVSGRFAGAYANNGVSNGDGVRGMVLRNGVGVGNVVETRNGVGTVQGQMRLCPGDTVDFAVHMRENYFYDSTLLTGRVVRTGDNPIACGGDGPIITHPPGNPTGLSGCCAPFSGLSILPSLTPMFPNGATGNYTMQYNAPAAMHAQMSAYLAYAYSMDNSITSMTLSWQAANFGTGATPAASGPAFGGPQTVTWTRQTNGTITVNPSTGGSFWTGSPFPVGSWIGFVTTLTHNGTPNSIHFPQNCRVQWNAWRAQAAGMRVGAPAGGGAGPVTFESIDTRGQVSRTRPIDVRPGVAIETGQLLIRDRPN